MTMRFHPLLALLLLVGCKPTPEVKPAMATPEKAEPDGAQKMAARLKQILAAPTPELASFLNLAEAETLRRQMESAADPQEKFPLYYRYCEQLLNAGKSEEAAAEIRNLMSQAGETDVNDRNKPLFDLLAIAYLRLGEQENCIYNHNGESCIIPLGPGGLHRLKKGSQNAVETYARILKKYPGDLNSQWLLNVAAMTLGEFPGRVPAKFRLPESAFRSSAAFPKFANIAGDIGVDIDGHAGGTVIEDFNNDGTLDILNSGWISDPMHFLVNNGDGTFTDKTAEAGLGGLMGGLNMVDADYNNDGFVDVLVLRGAWLRKGGNIPNSLLKNNGDGTFTDVTEAAGIYSEHPTQTAVWADFNLDGLLDLFIGNESGPGFDNPCEFYWNNGDGTFLSAAAPLGLDVSAFVKGVASGDVNDDGMPDLYLSVDGGGNLLFVNEGGTTRDDWKFQETGAEAGVRDPFWSFPTWFWDYDNDGHDDLFVCGYQNNRFEYVAEEEARAFKGLPPMSELPRLYRNNGDGTFTNVAPQTGMTRSLFAMGSNFEDIDNDGFLDFYLGTGAPDLRTIIPNRMFLNRNGKSFVDVTFSGGFGHLQKGHAVGFGDLDNDGDQDVYLDVGGVFENDTFRNALFENPGNANRWIILKLEGKTANRCAIGAKVRLTVSEKGKQRAIYRTVGTGGSFGASSLQLEAGLGEAEVVDEIRVAWPNARHTFQTFSAVAAGKKYRIQEGVDSLETLEYRPIPWHKETHAHHNLHP